MPGFPALTTRNYLCKIMPGDVADNYLLNTFYFTRGLIPILRKTGISQNAFPITILFLNHIKSRAIFNAFKTRISLCFIINGKSNSILIVKCK